MPSRMISLSHLRHKNWVSGFFRVNAIGIVSLAFNPRNALLMGYRITQNNTYDTGDGVHCTTGRIRTGRQRLTHLRVFCGKADWQVRRVREVLGQIGFSERRMTPKINRGQENGQ